VQTNGISRPSSRLSPQPSRSFAGRRGSSTEHALESQARWRGPPFADQEVENVECPVRALGCSTATSQEFKGFESSSSNPRFGDISQMESRRAVRECLGRRHKKDGKSSIQYCKYHGCKSGTFFHLELGADGPEHPRCAVAPRVAPHVDWHRQPGHAEGGGCPHNLLDSLLIWFQTVSSQSPRLFSTGSTRSPFQQISPKKCIIIHCQHCAAEGWASAHRDGGL